MGRFDTIKTTIDANIKENGTQEITGQKMNTILTEMVNATDAELTGLESLVGISTPSLVYSRDIGADGTPSMGVPTRASTERISINDNEPIKVVVKTDQSLIQIRNAYFYKDGVFVRYQAVNNKSFSIKSDGSWNQIAFTIWKTDYSWLDESLLANTYLWIEYEISKECKEYTDAEVAIAKLPFGVDLNLILHEDISGEGVINSQTNRLRTLILPVANGQIEVNLTSVNNDFQIRNAYFYKDGVFVRYQNVDSSSFVFKADPEWNQIAFTIRKTNNYSIEQNELENLSFVMKKDVTMVCTESRLFVDVMNGDLNASGVSPDYIVPQRVKTDKISTKHIQRVAIASEILEDYPGLQIRNAYFYKDGVFVKYQNVNSTSFILSHEPEWNQIALTIRDVTEVEIVDIIPKENLLMLEGTFVQQNAEDIQSLKANKTKDMVLLGSPSLYTSEDTTNIDVDVETLKHKDLISLYDELASNYPFWFSQTDSVGYDSNGNAIYHYTLRAGLRILTTTEGFSDNMWDDAALQPRRIMMYAGIHGNEKVAVFGQYLFIKELLESNEDWAKFIKSNFILEVIPCVNVWGFDNVSRLNFSGVDCNRDFWDKSQPETNAILSLYEQYKNEYIAIIDNHNTLGRASFLEMASSTKFMKMYTMMASQLTALFYDAWKTYFSEGTAYYAMVASPYLGLGTSSNYFNAQEKVCVVTESPRNITNGGETNIVKSCKFVKDQIGNVIQMVGQYGVNNL